MSPRVPELGTTVEQQRQRAVARRDGVKANAIGLYKLVIHRSSIREPREPGEHASRFRHVATACARCQLARGRGLARRVEGKNLLTIREDPLYVPRLAAPSRPPYPMPRW